MLPSIIYIALLVGLPLLLAVAFSFSDVTAGDPSFDWNVLANYSTDLRRPGVLAIVAKHHHFHRRFDGAHRGVRQGACQHSRPRLPRGK